MKKKIPRPKPKTTTKKIMLKQKGNVKKTKAVSIAKIIGLENLKPPLGAHKKKKLLGRGPSSGHGKTSTRGVKGQTSRAGRDFYLGFEGGQTPLIRRIPKRGFSNLKFKETYQVINIKNLEKIKEHIVDPQILENLGLIKNKDRLVKILGDGQLSRSLMVKAHAFSKRAKEIIEKAGGKTEIIHVTSAT
jgi:large subunit ribosomal protein L15